MNALFSIVILIASTLLFLAPASATTEYDFFRNKETTLAKLNPTGSFVLIKRISDDHTNIILLDIQRNNEVVVATNSLKNGYSIFDLGWLDDHTIAFTKSHFHRGAQTEIYKLTETKSDVAIRRSHSINHTYIYSHIPSVKNQFVALRYKDGKPQIFNIDLDKVIEAQFRSKFRINKKKLGLGRWLVNFDGTSNVYSIAHEDKPTEIYYRKDGKRKAKVVFEVDKKVFLSPQLLDKKQEHLYVITNFQSNYNHIRQISLQSGELSGILYIVKGRDIESLIVDDYSGKLIGYNYKQGGIARPTYIEEASTSGKYIVSRNRNSDLAIYTKGGIDSPFEFYLDNKGTETLLGSTMPWLSKYDLGKSHVINSVSSDGVTIESFLTMPANRDGENVPLIVMPHGGPIGIQDTRHFSATTHYFAHHGFAVLTPNYRGSSGYGKKFLSAGKKQWGRLIEDDIDSALKKSIKDFNIDPQKVCILGISYGGYSALISTIRFPEAYKCAVSYAGVTDLALLYSQTKSENEEAKKKIWSELAGDIDNDWDLLIEQSPVYNVDKIKVPVFIAQGGRDRIVDEENYLRMLYMLQHFKKEHEKLYMLNESHGFLKINSEIAFFKQARLFVTKWIEQD